MLLIFSDFFCERILRVALLRESVSSATLDYLVERSIVPILFSCLIVLSMVPRANGATWSMSILNLICANNSIVPLLGQSSLAIYIFQSVFVTFYFDFLVSGISNLKFPFRQEYVISYPEGNVCTCFYLLFTFSSILFFIFVSFKCLFIAFIYNIYIYRYRHFIASYYFCCFYSVVFGEKPLIQVIIGLAISIPISIYVHKMLQDKIARHLYVVLKKTEKNVNN